MEFKLEYLLALLIVIVPAIDYLLQKRKGRVTQDVSRETAQAPNSAKTLSRGVFIGLAISLALFGGYYLFDSGYFDGGFYEAISEKKSSDWKTFRGNNSRTGFYSGKGVPKLNRIRWKFKSDDRIDSSPAVSDGVVYVGSWDNHLYALDVDGISLKILNKSFIANISEWDRQFLRLLLITSISVAIWGYGIRIILFLIWVIRDGIRWSFKTMFKE